MCYTYQLYKYMMRIYWTEMRRRWYRSWTDLVYEKARNYGIIKLQPAGVTVPAALIWICWVIVDTSFDELIVWDLSFYRNCQVLISIKFGLSATNTTITILICLLLFTSHHSALRRSRASGSEHPTSIMRFGHLIDCFIAYRISSSPSNIYHV